jgi:cobalt/nickel transport system ATP-binding protein
MNYVECKNVSFSYENGIEVLKNINFIIKNNESVGIIGANGAGKSTLLRILIGLELEFAGEVKVNQHLVSKKTLPQVRSQSGYLFQNSDNQLFTQTVFSDVAFALKNIGLDERTVNDRVMSALETVGIKHLRDKKIYKMSGGEKKLASISTILAMAPNILLLDEPSIALDPKNRRMLIDTLNRLDYVKLIASHDLDMILETCERVILISEGGIVCDGPAEVLLSNKELLEQNGLELPLSLSGYHKRIHNY